MHYNNFPVGGIYDIAIDRQSYTIYGGTQDDATVYGQEIKSPSSRSMEISLIDPWDGGDGCISAIDPEDDNTVYYSAQHGDARRHDKVLDTAVSIEPKLPKEIIKDTLTLIISPPTSA